MIISLRGYAFFLWGPDVDKAWTVVTKAKTEAAPRKRIKTDKDGGRPKIKITSAMIKAEIERRRKAGEPSDHKTLGLHFHCSKETIGRRLKATSKLSK